MKILRVLWERGEATVAEVHRALSREKRRAYTTIATMLRKMEERGLVGHRADGRAFRYAARVQESEVTRGATNDVLQRLFRGSLTEMVSHLLAERGVSDAELRELESLIREQRRRK